LTITENVSQIIGIAVPSMLECETTGACSIQKQSRTLLSILRTNKIGDASPERIPIEQKMFSKLPEKPSSLVDFIHLAILFDSLNTGLKTMTFQQLAKEMGLLEKKKKRNNNSGNFDRLDAHKWLSNEQCNHFKENIRGFLGTNQVSHKDAMWEVKVEMLAVVNLDDESVHFLRPDIGLAAPSSGTIKQYRLVGALDVWTAENVILEIKCTTHALTNEHKLQLALYCFMVHHLQTQTGLAKLTGGEPGDTAKVEAIMAKDVVKFKLLSACTGEAHSMVYGDGLEALVKRILVAFAKRDTGQVSDKPFIAEAQGICNDPAAYVKKMLHELAEAEEDLVL
jgi:hypothetical protein